MSENPDDIRADIEATRARLGTSVDAVADKVTPSHIAQRQADKVKDALFGVKEKVMGAADDTVNYVQTTGEGATSHIHEAGSAIADAPHQMKAKTQGNPLAAGLIAFGAGLLLSALVPASQKEREAAESLKSAAEPLTTEVTEAAKDLAQGLKEPVQTAMENVKATAADATEQLKAEGQTAVTEVKDRTTEAKDNVQQS
ncbi:gas vesicle protein [Neomicrococcus aestuarii]|uniref:Gas vesicle protein n=1 Tax=Neomicrococcus aestuarii TaxID=556325 RepID=A0A7W8X2J8_9MICC|nr:DUF3618 domain-containing protein [Neomicrococcus aestuarii]MBB5513979.1 gas vesicle protein [Neomicrococcus aestuarii]